MTGLLAGDVVVSVSGRDAGRKFFVLEVNGQKVVIYDGSMRRTEKPKTKNIKHVKFLFRPDNELNGKIPSGETMTNSEIRRRLNVVNSLLSDAKGGDISAERRYDRG